FLLMVDRYPAHPLSMDAYRWMIRHNGSSEARRRHELGQFLILRQQEYGVEASGGREFPGDGATRKKVPEATRTEVRQQQETMVLSSKAEARKWYQGALEIEPRLE